MADPTPRPIPHDTARRHPEVHLLPTCFTVERATPSRKRPLFWIGGIYLFAIGIGLGVIVERGASRPTYIPAPPAVTFTPAPLVAPGPLRIGEDRYLWTASRGEGSYEFAWPQSQEDMDLILKAIGDIEYQNGMAAPREPIQLPPQGEPKESHQ